MFRGRSHSALRRVFPALAVAALALGTASPVLAQSKDGEADGEAVAESTTERQARVTVETVHFLSADGKTNVTGYVFKAADAPAKAPAMVMMHGRAGAYSSLAEGEYNASTLASRHKMWGRFWARRGYIAIMVDDFGPLGYPKGFGRGTYEDRPAELDEVAYRPLHAYGALKYLRSRPDVDPKRIGLMGWSNGGSTTLSAMANDKPEGIREAGFRAGVAFYPGCGLKNRFDRAGYKPYNSVLVLIGTADEEVSPTSCDKLVARSRNLGGDIDIRFYKGAEHGFDTPVKSKQSLQPNADAKADAMPRTAAFFDEKLGVAK